MNRDLSERTTAWIDGGWLNVRSSQLSHLLGKQVAFGKEQRLPADVWSASHDPRLVQFLSDLKKLDMARDRQAMFDELRDMEREAKSWTPSPEVRIEKTSDRVMLAVEDEYIGDEYGPASIELTPQQAEWIGKRLLQLAKEATQ